MRISSQARFLFRSGILACLLVGADAAAQELIEHRVNIPDPDSHYLHVQSRFPVTGQELELMMAVWTPGSYLVREFSRHLEDFSATSDGGPVAIERTAKNRWRLTVPADEPVTVDYRVYAHEMSVRTSFVDAEFALINPTTAFLVPVDGLHLAHLVRLDHPQGWEVHSALTASRGGWLAADYDELADSPLLLGQAQVGQFEVRGIPHFMVHVGDHRFWDLQQANADVARLVSRQLLFWGDVPFRQPYYFLNLINESSGGLEHERSTVMMTSRWAMRRREDYLDWLKLVSHEYFHAWNVKRLRPAGLETYDYESENYVTGLWLSEGFTSYYGPLLLVRSGLMTPKEWFADLAERIRQLETRPGRFASSPEQASFDAWIKHYRQDENSVNSTVSYYNKGAILALLLDAAIREGSDERRSLDDMMRELYAAHAGSAGFTSAQAATQASAQAGADLSPWFARYVSGTEDLDYSAALDWYGLELIRALEPDEPPDTFSDPPRASLGAKVEVRDGKLMVQEVPRGSAAHSAGISAEDEIIAIAQVRLEPQSEAWTELFGRLRVGDPVEVLLARRGRLLTLTAVLEAEIAEKWTLRRSAQAGPVQLNRLRRWLGRGWFLEESTTPAAKP